MKNPERRETLKGLPLFPICEQARAMAIDQIASDPDLVFKDE